MDLRITVFTEQGQEQKARWSMTSFIWKYTSFHNALSIPSESVMVLMLCGCYKAFPEFLKTSLFKIGFKVAKCRFPPLFSGKMHAELACLGQGCFVIIYLHLSATNVYTHSKAQTGRYRAQWGKTGLAWKMPCILSSAPQKTNQPNHQKWNKMSRANNHLRQMCYPYILSTFQYSSKISTLKRQTEFSCYFWDVHYNKERNNLNFNY